VPLPYNLEQETASAIKNALFHQWAPSPHQDNERKEECQGRDHTNHALECDSGDAYAVTRRHHDGSEDRRESCRGCRRKRDVGKSKDPCSTPPAVHGIRQRRPAEDERRI
jgi:hypothetical protein